MSGKDYYERGRDEYNHSDWVNARKDFQAAIDNGYTKKPDLWHDSAGTYLARIDSTKSNTGVAKATPAPAPAGDRAADAALNAAARAEELSHEQATVQSDLLVKQARESQLAGKTDEARDLYAQAVHLNPSNATAQAGLDEILTLEGRNPNGPSALAAAAEQVNIRRQEIEYRFDTAIKGAKEAIGDHKWDVASADIQRAELAAGADRAIFSAQDLRNFDQTLDQTKTALIQTQESVKINAATEQQRAAVLQIEQERKRAVLERESTIKDLRRTAVDLVKQARYKEALGVVDQILQLDPTDVYAQGVRPMLEDRWEFQAQRGVIEQRNRLIARTLTNADEHMIPYDDVLR